MSEFIDTVLVEPFRELLETLLDFLPNLLAFLLIIVAGTVLGAFLAVTTRRVLKVLQVDRHAQQTGVRDMLRKGGVADPPSGILGRLVGWLTVLAFLFMAMNALNLPAVDRILERFILYLPNVFMAAVIILLGFLLAGFLGRAALIAAVNARVKAARTLGYGVRLMILTLALAMALEQLGIGKETVVSAFAILFGGVVLALALAFGLGGKELARTYLERKIRGRGEKEDDLTHL